MLRISRGYSLDNQVKDAENTTEIRLKDGYNSAERRVKDGVKDAHFHGKTELQTLQEDGERGTKPGKMPLKWLKVWKDTIRAPGKTVQSRVKDGVKVGQKDGRDAQHSRQRRWISGWIFWIRRVKDAGKTG